MNDPVAELLRSKGIHFTPSGQDYLTKCFNPDHQDSHPSFRIDKTTGISHCFSCGYKMNVFKFYGILTNNVSIKIHKLKEKIRELKQVSNGLEPMEQARPMHIKYRGISVQTYKEFGAFTTELNDDVNNRVFIPIKDVRDKVVSYIGRHMLSSGNPKYLVYPPGATTPPFPVKLEGSPKAIVLVEGILDMLNMYDKGARNVVCVFGTVKLFNNTGTKLLPYKVMGVQKIFLLFDGDKAGRESAARIKPLIEEEGFICEIINLPDDVDPGGMDQEEVEQITKYTKYD